MKKCYGMKKDNLLCLIGAHIRRVKSIVGSILSGKKELGQYMYGESKKTTQQVKDRIDLFEKLDIVQ